MFLGLGIHVVALFLIIPWRICLLGTKLLDRSIRKLNVLGDKLMGGRP